MACDADDVTGLVMVFSSLGIFALATFNVDTRTSQIGTRRAVGARRLDIVRYFLVENWLITTARSHRGLLAGAGGRLLALLAVSVAAPQPLLPGGWRAGLWALGQFAAWQPALRAAQVSPAMATRNYHDRRLQPQAGNRRLTHDGSHIQRRGSPGQPDCTGRGR